ncbi:hypothetical protein [Algibacter sp. PT7-4]
MKSIIKISRHINNVTRQNLLSNKRIIAFQVGHPELWKGTKRYAH